MYKRQGWNNANSNQSFALITPQHIIGANHFQPGVGATINFFGASGSIVSRTVSGIATVQNGGSNTDVFVAQLSSVLSGSEVPYYRFPSDLASASLVGRAMYAYGFPAQVGQNTIASRDGIAAVAAFGNQAELANTPTFEFVYDSAFAANGQARAEPGDSGSPTFIQENGTYVLAGTHSALAQVGTVYTTGDADLTRMMNEINTAIGSLGSTGFQIDQIPEPSASSLVLLSVFAFCISRSRGKNAK